MRKTRFRGVDLLGSCFFHNPVFLMCVLTVSCALGSDPSSAPTAMSLEAVYNQCGLPAACTAPTPWEGKQVTVWGAVDADNIFDKRHFPRLPHEKFRLIDGSGRSLEVWPQASDNRLIFDKLARRTGATIRVTGRLKAVQLPIAGQCLLGLKIVIDDPSRIEF
jgi:hypothetical protein